MKVLKSDLRDFRVEDSGQDVLVTFKVLTYFCATKLLKKETPDSIFTDIINQTDRGLEYLRTKVEEAINRRLQDG